MLEDEMTRTLIIKMADICKEYYEPYDSEDRCEEAKRNRDREIKFNIYKDLLIEHWNKTGR